MEANLDKKTCKMCSMEIPKDARKCPYCQHYQNRATMFMFHPAFAVVITCLPMVAILFAFSMLFDRGVDYQDYKGQIAISDSRIVFGDNNCGATVGVIGTIKNDSAIPWTDIHFHVEFFDAAGKRVDVKQEDQFGYYLPAHKSLSFKISFRREFPELCYVKDEIQVISAKDGRARW